MAEAIIGVVFLILALLATLVGLGSLGTGDTIIGVGMLLLAASLFIVVVLCTLSSMFSKAVDHLAAMRRHVEEPAIRTQPAAEVGTERWETLCTSLERLEAVVETAKPQSPVAEVWEPIGNPAEPSGVDDSLPPILKARCPQCGKTVKAKPDWAGRVGKCPNCGRSIQFPESSAASP